MAKENNYANHIEFRVGTFREDIFSQSDDPYKFDILLYYLKEAYPRIYYYDNIDYKYSNTFETIARHLASGNAEDTLVKMIQAMDDHDCIYLYGLTEPICDKKQLLNRVEQITQEE